MRDLSESIIPSIATGMHRADFDAIPEELRAQHIWAVTCNGPTMQESKRPRDVRTGMPIGANNPDAWCTFEEALAAVKAGYATGLGLCKRPSDGFVAVDLDRVIREDGSHHPAVKALGDLLESCWYLERSRSGKGYHVLLRGNWRDETAKRGAVLNLDPSDPRPERPTIQVFWDFQFVIMTGDAVTRSGNPRGGDDQQRLDALQEFTQNLEPVEKPKIIKFPTPSGRIFTSADRERKAQDFVAQAVGKVERGEDTRNNLGAWLAMQLRDLPLEEEEAWPFMGAYQQTVQWRTKDDEYTEQEARDTFRGIFKTPRREPPRRLGKHVINSDDVALEYRLTAHGNAELFAEMHGENVRHLPRHNRTYIFDETAGLWNADEADLAKNLGLATLDELYRRAQLENGDRRQAMIKHALRSDNSSGLSDMLNIAKLLPPIKIVGDSPFDADQMVLAVENGVIDLRNGELRPLTRDDYISRRGGWLLTDTLNIKFGYDPNMPCPHWEAFLDMVLQGDKELIRYVQKAVGYSLTGDTSYHALFMPWGNGNNGKSTFITTIEALAGTHCETLPIESLIARHGDPSIPNDIAKLEGARLVVTGENEQGKNLAESRVKGLIGGDRVTARFMHGEYFSFQPRLKLWLHTNHKPRVRGGDDGIWRRLKLIPFTYKIPDDKVNEHFLEECLVPELPGIMAWAIQGCLLWQREGIKEPPAVRGATDEYRVEMDVVAQFLDEMTVCNPDDPQVRVRATDLYHAYQQWAIGRGERPMTQTMFGTRVSAARPQCEKRNVGGKGMCLIGLDLSSNVALGQALGIDLSKVEY